MPGNRGRPRKQLAGPALPEPLEYHWTLAQIAVSVQLTPAALLVRIDAGELKAVKFGKEWRVADSALRDWLRRAATRPQPQEATR